MPRLWKEAVDCVFINREKNRVIELLTGCSKKIVEACVMFKMISENLNVFVDELRVALNIVDKTSENSCIPAVFSVII